MDGFLVRFDSVFTEGANRAARAFGEEARETPGVTEILPALASVQVRFDREVCARPDIAEVLEDLIASRDWLALPEEPATRIWHVPVSFDGADGVGLDRACEQTGLSQEQAVQQILDARPRVIAIGFAPGQPYLGLLPQEWDFPRQTELTKEVPPGALTVAIRQLVLFANPSPTGWLQIARTAFRPFQPEAEDPMPLRAGDMFRFHRISLSEREALTREGGSAGGRLEVLS